MPLVPVRIVAPAREVREGLRRVRDELHVPSGFPDAVREAARAASGKPVDEASRVDARDLPLVTIDPPRSRDLDQALLITRRRAGYRVHYAIADLAAFVTAGDDVDREAHERGVTLYLPDGRAPLYPNAIGQGAASLLPGRDRPALLWTIDLDADGDVTASRVERSLVRSRHALAYEDVQRDLDATRPDEPFALLQEVGGLREARERDRGGVSFRIPAQEVVPVPGGYRLEYDTPLPVEDWNAQISLLTGMVAAEMMIDAGVGILRVLPPAPDWTIVRLRRTAHALGVDWPASTSYPEVVHGIAADSPEHAAFLTQAVRTLRGAGYALVGEEPGPAPVHAALAMHYAHVTAPLRRLADRFANEVVLASSAGVGVPAWAVDGLPALPKVMEDADRRAAAVERASIDLVEALVLRRHVGDRVHGSVVDADDDRATVQLVDPPVVASVDTSADTPARGGYELGAEVDLVVRSADPLSRKVVLEAQ